jgi:dipeptidyl aminopeptidase/acylaminoacyl peptidase
MPRDRDWIDEEDERLGRRPRRSKRRKETSYGWLIGLFAGAVVLGLVCCGGGVFIVYRWFVNPTSFPPQTEDYADARRSFQTKLVHQGPAPQPWDIEVPPPGVQEIEYVSGNLKLKAWVDKPAAPKPLKPAVLFLHGGFAFGEDDWEQAQPFRDAGYVTMLPMLRGENGLPGSYSMFYNEVDDVLAAADTFAKIPGVDPKRIFIAGHSVGGTLTLLAAMTTNRFRAAASFSGSPDQIRWSRFQPESIVFDRKDPREMYMRSPLAYPRSFKCPARLYYGTDEFLFENSSLKTAELAKEAGLDVEAISVPGDHISAVEPAMQQAIQFFKTIK